MLSSLKLWHLAEVSCVDEFELVLLELGSHGSLWLRPLCGPLRGMEWHAMTGECWEKRAQTNVAGKDAA